MSAPRAALALLSEEGGMPSQGAGGGGQGASDNVLQPHGSWTPTDHDH